MRFISCYLGVLTLFTIELAFSQISSSDTARSLNILYAGIKDRMDIMPASLKHHHFWPGGYRTHITEVMDFGIMLYNKALESGKITSIMTLDDVIVCAFVHDLDKLWRYKEGGESPTEGQVKYAKSLGISVSDSETKTSISRKIDIAKGATTSLLSPEKKEFTYDTSLYAIDDSAFVCKKCFMLSGLVLSDLQLHAITLHHGGWADKVRAGGRCEFDELAALLHCADLMSSHVLGHRVPDCYK